MFKIYNGRENFYQWDLEQRLIVEDASINEVHFCNKTDDCSLVSEVYEQDGLRLVNVPNILLQDSWAIRVYAYCTNYTKVSETFKVTARSKPADYIYTETEVLNYNTLLNRINEIDENIADAVNEWLKENPLDVDLTGYATEDYVDNAVDNIAIPDVSNFVDGKYVQTAINESLPDLSDYALKSEIPSLEGYAKTSDLDTFITESQVDEKIGAIKIPEPDLSDYAKTEDIPDVSGFQTEAQVIALIEAHGGGTLPASEEAEF